MWTTEKPLAPTHLHVTQLGVTSATIEWEKPYDCGGSPLTRYILEKRQSGEAEWECLTSLPPNINECELENMISEKGYFLRIRAENKFGVSQPHELQEPIRVRCLQKGEPFVNVCIVPD